MRDIKFKAQRADGEGWVFGYLFENIWPKGHLSYIIERCFVPANSMPSDNFIEVIPETVCQFTGLQDRNGVDIYDGDELDDGKSIITVEYTSFLRNIKNYFLRNSKVIGNIHDK